MKTLPQPVRRGTLMRYDVTTLGELVIDLVPTRTPEGLAYLPKPGGAPANVAAGMARLGHPAAMITKVGNEAFGTAAVSALEAAGVAIDAVIRAPAHNTALAVVTQTASGETDFFFYRENCADANLTPGEVPTDLIAASKILHIGTLLLASPISAAAQRHAITCARSKGVLVSADLNFRLAFWRDPERMRAAGLEVVRAASIVKVSRDELSLLAGTGDTEAAVRSLWDEGMIAFAVTRGVDGADLFTENAGVSVPGFPVAVVDTVGCGDAFMASLLSGLIESRFQLQADSLRLLALRACAAGALVATRSGALETMPSRAEIDAFLRERLNSRGPTPEEGVAG
ncbi:MAG TPA: carbohydrate kinase [Propylenella sp.]|nr:carbohydrate kinase [Propylenella sp.]